VFEKVEYLLPNLKDIPFQIIPAFEFGLTCQRSKALESCSFPETPHFTVLTYLTIWPQSVHIGGGPSRARRGENWRFRPRPWITQLLYYTLEVGTRLSG
jgi:hypothetical protein